jgi:hypothetical protein
MDTGKYNKPMWIGKRYGRLTVIRPEHVVLANGNKEWRWLCRCDCGKEKIMKPIELIKGKNVSCGCYKKENARKTAFVTAR